MSIKRQNNQLRLAFGEEGRSEAPMASGEGSEMLTAKRISESPAQNQEQLMEQDVRWCGRGGEVTLPPYADSLNRTA